jgi:hypothetical protein
MTLIKEPTVAEDAKPAAVLYLYNHPSGEFAFNYGFDFVDESGENKSGAAHYVLATIISLIKNGHMVELTDIFIDSLPAMVEATEEESA